jgi:hypothetical protein
MIGRQNLLGNEEFKLSIKLKYEPANTESCSQIFFLCQCQQIHFVLFII